MQLYFGGQDVSRQVLVHCQWEFPVFCSLLLGVPWFLFIATGSSLIFVHCHWEFPRLGVCRVKKYHTIYQGKSGKACTKVVEIIFIWLSLCFRGSSATESCPDFLIAVFSLLLKIKENQWTSNELRWENQYVFILNITLIDNTIKLNPVGLDWALLYYRWE